MKNNSSILLGEVFPESPILLKALSYFKVFIETLAIKYFRKSQ